MLRDLARSVLLTLPLDTIDAHPDPGEPSSPDRDLIKLPRSRPRCRAQNATDSTSRKKQSSASRGLQLRLPAGFKPAQIRKALEIALQLARGEQDVTLDAQPGEWRRLHDELESQLARLKALTKNLVFEPLPHGVNKIEEAFYVFGLTPRADSAEIRRRFKTLATLFHPDNGLLGDHRRIESN